ncbi:hypothetical protein DRN85_07820 [Methanosarcinales archaeon]|nr:MAG: hypothetical protein DRN85_07820 [Methanosarcinales archaeon]
MQERAKPVSSPFYIEESNFFEYNINQVVLLPIDVFNNDSLSSLETVTKYMKEELNYRFRDIALLLNRSQKTVWDAYNDSRKKMDSRFSLDKDIRFLIPSIVFRDRSVSFLEALTEYLKDNLNLRYCQIASLLNRDPRTIWTVYHRAKNKRKNGIS